MIEAVLAAAVMIYGVAGALASLLQLRRIREQGSSRDVSLAYLAVYGGGYVLWLAYGIAIHSVPLIVADAVGAAAMAVTICVATQMRIGVHCTSFVRARLCRRTGSSPGVESALAEELAAPAIERSTTSETRSVSARRGRNRWPSRQGSSLTNPPRARARGR